MDDQRRSVALVGMPGAGKSTVGALLAERLGWTFYDTDLLLEATFGKPIARVFQDPGERAFRAAEALLVGSLMSLESAVLATGGGLWTSPAARRRLSAFAYTIYLAIPPEVLARRVAAAGGGSLRPLLAGMDPEGALRRLLTEREPAYELADWRLECGSMDPQSIVQHIVRRLKTVGLVAARGVAA